MLCWSIGGRKRGRLVVGKELDWMARARVRGAIK